MKRLGLWFAVGVLLGCVIWLVLWYWRLVERSIMG